jgi:hypothetical protein
LIGETGLMGSKGSIGFTVELLGTFFIPTDFFRNFQIMVAPLFLYFEDDLI